MSLRALGASTLPLTTNRAGTNAALAGAAARHETSVTQPASTARRMARAAINGPVPVPAASAACPTARSVDDIASRLDPTGPLHASGEELIGQVAVGQCPGELQASMLLERTRSRSSDCLKLLDDRA